MTLLLIFIIAIICVSGLLYGLARLFQAFDRRVEQWPLLWATCLGLSVLIPALGTLLLILPNWVPTSAFELLSLHEPLQSLGLLPPLSIEASGGPQGFVMPDITKIVVIPYVLGVLIMAAKLLIGRYRIRRLLTSAERLNTLSGGNVWVSSQAVGPFAWTPLGRPAQAKIVIPERYLLSMSAESLDDIVRHEREHIARRDDECGLILRLLLCVCWLSPFAHGLFGRWSHSTEIRCDMAVTAGRTLTMRKAYADTLLQAIHIAAGRVMQYPAASFSTHRIRNEKMRITHIMTGTRPTYKRGRARLGLALTASALTALGVITLSTTANAGNKAPQAVKVADNQVPVKQAATATVKAPTLAPNVQMVVTGRLTSKFGPAKDPFNDGAMRDHFGVDIAAATGTPIYAPADGLVMAATDAYRGNPKYGNVVALKTDGGVLTVFAHLDGYSVAAGQTVTQGTQIATVGSSGKSTGPHVHIETYRNGTRIDPMGVWTIVTD